MEKVNTYHKEWTQDIALKKSNLNKNLTPKFFKNDL